MFAILDRFKLGMYKKCFNAQHKRYCIFTSTNNVNKRYAMAQLS